MSRIIIVDFRDDEDFGSNPYMSYLKQTLNLVSFIEQVPELWKLDDFFMECVAEYLNVKRQSVAFTRLWNISIDHSSNVGLITEEKFFPIIKKG